MYEPEDGSLVISLKHGGFKNDTTYNIFIYFNKIFTLSCISLYIRYSTPRHMNLIIPSLSQLNLNTPVYGAGNYFGLLYYLHRLK